MRTVLSILRLEVRPVKRPDPDFGDVEAALQQQKHFDSLAPTPDCLDELAIADVVDGVLTGERRGQVLAHLELCARCRSVVQATAALVADEAVAHASPGKRQPLRWARASIGIAAAAAAVILVVLIPRDRDVTLREPAVTNAIAPLTLSPRGNVAVVERLVWSRVPGAERYRLRIHRPDGSVVWSSETEDSSLALPATVQLSPRETYHWRVEALTGWRRWVESEMTQFRIEPGR